MPDDSPYPSFVCHSLDGACRLYAGRLPGDLTPDDEHFDLLWCLHPPGFNTIPMAGGPVQIPRYQQTYERAYRYTGRVYAPLTAPPCLRSFLNWGKVAIDGRLNGILVNWYDGKLGHHIGRHRDNTDGLLPDAPIVTISLGEERAFRLRPWHGKGFQDFAAAHGAVFVLPYDTNLAWTHEVPRAAHHTDRRISVTLRAFVDVVQTPIDGLE